MCTYNNSQIYLNTELFAHLWLGERKENQWRDIPLAAQPRLEAGHANRPHRPRHATDRLQYNTSHNHANVKWGWLLSWSNFGERNMALLLLHSLELDYMTGCNHGEDVDCVLYNNFVDTPPVKQAGRSIIVTSLQSNCNRYSFLFLYFACNSCIFKNIKISYVPSSQDTLVWFQFFSISHHFVCWV